uniref:RNA-dependent RNA polymerase n=1 Tax=Chromera velia CCMP2878 TaxID=1169474 RepID=A0A0G4G423_9ALVE|eukprot:Cvel_20195.t1-p1 / transcript=Cvel_20195.t1 / gene=Cvel_20195 / organism=Chromera_velia_CCMP2878 / gene_product=hypothetical protein / transcript_product=hypothetical protein / location=Cvel_scaffold1796:11635-18444(-) / protein_length=1231 / sequence_SO=supercontig / SO=protein_coding / is_pseudo=false
MSAESHEARASTDAVGEPMKDRRRTPVRFFEVGDVDGEKLHYRFIEKKKLQSSRLERAIFEHFKRHRPEVSFGNFALDRSISEERRKGLLSKMFGLSHEKGMIEAGGGGSPAVRWYLIPGSDSHMKDHTLSAIRSLQVDISRPLRILLVNDIEIDGENPSENHTDGNCGISQELAAEILYLYKRERIEFYGEGKDKMAPTLEKFGPEGPLTWQVRMYGESSEGAFGIAKGVLVRVRDLPEGYDMMLTKGMLKLGPDNPNKSGGGTKSGWKRLEGEALTPFFLPIRMPEGDPRKDLGIEPPTFQPTHVFEGDISMEVIGPEFVSPKRGHLARQFLLHAEWAFKREDLQRVIRDAFRDSADVAETLRRILRREVRRRREGSLLTGAGEQNPDVDDTHDDIDDSLSVWTQPEEAEEEGRDSTFLKDRTGPDAIVYDAVGAGWCAKAGDAYILKRVYQKMGYNIEQTCKKVQLLDDGQGGRMMPLRMISDFWGLLEPGQCALIIDRAFLDGKEGLVVIQGENTVCRFPINFPWEIQYKVIFLSRDSPIFQAFLFLGLKNVLVFSTRGGARHLGMGGDFDGDEGWVLSHALLKHPDKEKLEFLQHVKNLFLGSKDSKSDDVEMPPPSSFSQSPRRSVSLPVDSPSNKVPAAAAAASTAHISSLPVSHGCRSIPFSKGPTLDPISEEAASSNVSPPHQKKGLTRRPSGLPTVSLSPDSDEDTSPAAAAVSTGLRSAHPPGSSEFTPPGSFAPLLGPGRGIPSEKELPDSLKGKRKAEEGDDHERQKMRRMSVALCPKEGGNRPKSPHTALTRRHALPAMPLPKGITPAEDFRTLTSGRLRILGLNADMLLFASAILSVGSMTWENEKLLGYGSARIRSNPKLLDKLTKLHPLLLDWTTDWQKHVGSAPTRTALRAPDFRVDFVKDGEDKAQGTVGGLGGQYPFFQWAHQMKQWRGLRKTDRGVEIAQDCILEDLRERYLQTVMDSEARKEENMKEAVTVAPHQYILKHSDRVLEKLRAIKRPPGETSRFDQVSAKVSDWSRRYLWAAMALAQRGQRKREGEKEGRRNVGPRGRWRSDAEQPSSSQNPGEKVFQDIRNEVDSLVTELNEEVMSRVSETQKAVEERKRALCEFQSNGRVGVDEVKTKVEALFEALREEREWQEKASGLMLQPCDIAAYVHVVEVRGFFADVKGTSRGNFSGRGPPREEARPRDFYGQRKTPSFVTAFLAGGVGQVGGLV